MGCLVLEDPELSIDLIGAAADRAVAIEVYITEHVYEVELRDGDFVIDLSVAIIVETVADLGLRGRSLVIEAAGP